jgi:hypothetical protein
MEQLVFHKGHLPRLGKLIRQDRNEAGGFILRDASVSCIYRPFRADCSVESKVEQSYVPSGAVKRVRTPSRDVRVEAKKASSGVSARKFCVECGVLGTSGVERGPKFC